MLEHATFPLVILHHLHQILCFLHFPLIYDLLFLPITNTLIIRGSIFNYTLLLESLHFLFLHLIQTLFQVNFLKVEAHLLSCLVGLGLQPLLSDFLVIGQFLCQIGPLEFGEVADGPNVIVEQVMTLFSTDLLTV